jgi:hypothetical protein
VAGGGTACPGGAHPAGQARVSDPVAAAIDASGNVLLADYGAHRVAVVAERTGRFYGQRMTAGRIYNLAGNGDYGAAGNGGKATAAAVTPVGVAADQGNVVIGDYPDGDVRLVAETTGRFFGQAMKAGDIYHLAGDGNPGFGPASGAPVVPDSVAVDRPGNVVLADPVTCTIQVIAARTGPFYGQAMIVGHVYTVAGDGQPEPSGDGGPATAAGLDPQAATIDPAGNIVIADAYGLIRVVAVATGMFYGQAMTAGDIYSVAGGGTAGLGDGGPARAAELDFPVAVAVEPSGAIVVGDLSRVRLITP